MLLTTWECVKYITKNIKRNHKNCLKYNQSRKLTREAWSKIMMDSKRVIGSLKEDREDI